ncbi:MAG TPA: SDR family oxidoreductase [Anaerolineae bacterium]|nr:SDR family oxidoreductase [Anaerolineae bacterium]
MEIAGKTALVTGGARRVGRAITLALAGAGANVVINYHRSAAPAQETAAEARALGVEALPVQADVADHEQVAALVAAARERFGAVDILVNGASLWQKTPFPTADLTAWRRVTDILIHGPFYCANAVAPLMLDRGEGAVVNIVDLSVWQPWPGYTAHSVGKAALMAITRQLALELAPTVRVNAVAPGPVLPPPGYDEAKIARTAARTLLGRWGKAQDVADAVLFLVRADYITGEVIVVDGGERIGCRGG